MTMAACGSTPRRLTNDFATSYFQSTACLSDWWLIKAEKGLGEKWLAVQGKESHALGKAVRTFTSAPIAKRYDVFSLETTDGICILLKGFINKAQTVANGFSPDIFKSFLFGFPLHWEQFAATCFTGIIPASPASRSGPAPQGNRPMTRLLSHQQGDAVAYNSTPSPVTPSPEETPKYRKDEKKYKKYNSTPSAVTPLPEETPKYRKDEKKCKKVKTSSNKYAPSHAAVRTEESSMSPNSFKRSRSGRLLLPKLQFWCNETAVYDRDRNITEVQIGNAVVYKEFDPSL